MIEDCLKLRQSAAQMWLLMRILPFLVGDLIPRNDMHWECYLKLVKICNIATASSVSRDTTLYLQLLIEEHHLQFCELYGSNSVIPKMHFIIHYPSQLLRFGPLVHAWTMRYEAKLRVIKRAARISNFKNVCQTVAKRHQHLLCYYLHTNKLLSRELEVGPSKSPFLLSEECIEVQTFLKNCSLQNCSLISHPSFVKCNGVMFKPNVYILLAYDVFEPHFRKVIDLLSTDIGVFIVYHECMTHCFCSASVSRGYSALAPDSTSMN